MAITTQRRLINPRLGTYFGIFTSGFVALDDNLTSTPPDSAGAVGPRHVMTTLNSEILIQDRQGKVLSRVILEDFWKPTGTVNTAFDPRLLYDRARDRWVFCVLAEPQSSNAVVLIALTALLLFIAGVPLLRFVVPGIVGTALAALYVAFNPYALRRVLAFLDPFRDSLGAGWQLVQSYLAFGQGGFVGTGLGNSRQKLDYLPEAHTDFVLALVAEELGLVGVLFVIGCFAALWVAGTRVARRAQNKFDVLCGFAMVALLTIPAFLNASVVMGLVPTKGLTLPFLSYGRTSLVVCCLALGILLGVARRHPRAQVAQIREATWPGVS